MKKEVTYTRQAIKTTFADLPTSEEFELLGSYVVTPETNQEYQAAMDDPNPWYGENSVAHPNAVSDLTHEFVQNSFHFLLPAGQGTMHTKQATKFIKPVRLGKRVLVRGRISEKYVKRGRNYVVWELEQVDEDGTLLVVVKTTRTVGKAED